LSRNKFLKGREMIRYLVVLVVAVFATGWAGDVKKVDLNVNGMHCDQCADKVKSALKKVQDVQDVQVSMEKGTAQISLAPNSSTKTEVLAKAVADAGYGASYEEGTETKTLVATKVHHEDKDCDEKVGTKVDCAKDGKSDCCGEKATKTKVIKKK